MESRWRGQGVEVYASPFLLLDLGSKGKKNLMQMVKHRYHVSAFALDFIEGLPARTRTRACTHLHTNTHTYTHMQARVSRAMLEQERSLRSTIGMDACQSYVKQACEQMARGMSTSQGEPHGY